MIERVIEQRKAIELVLNNRSVTNLEMQRKLSLKMSHWKFLEAIVKGFKSFDRATNPISSETNSTIAMVRPVIHSIIYSFLNLDDRDSETILLLKETLEEQLRTRFLNEQPQQVFRIACFLDGN